MAGLGGVGASATLGERRRVAKGSAEYRRMKSKGDTQGQALGRGGGGSGQAVEQWKMISMNPTDDPEALAQQMKDAGASEQQIQKRIEGMKTYLTDLGVSGEGLHSGWGIEAPTKTGTSVTQESGLIPAGGEEAVSEYGPPPATEQVDTGVYPGADVPATAEMPTTPATVTPARDIRTMRQDLRKQPPAGAPIYGEEFGIGAEQASPFFGGTEEARRRRRNRYTDEFGYMMDDTPYGPRGPWQF